jgi:large subunit ribosomal protein L29
MKKSKTSDLKSLGREELNQKLSVLKKELFDLRQAAAAGKLEKSHQLSLAKKDVARVTTLLKELDRNAS